MGLCDHICNRAQQTFRNEVRGLRSCDIREKVLTASRRKECLPKSVLSVSEVSVVETGVQHIQGIPSRVSFRESQDKENSYLSFSPQSLLHHSGCGSTESQHQNCTVSVLAVSSCTPGCVFASLTGCKCPFSCFLFPASLYSWAT